MVKKKKINLVYEKKEVNENELHQIVNDVREERIHGLNVTLPYKQKIMEFVDEIDISAKNSFAVNTIYKRKEKVIGANTDGKGLVDYLIKDENISLLGKNVLLIGAGGATYGIVSELIKQRLKRIEIANRTEANANKLIKDFNFSQTPIIYKKWVPIKPSPKTDLIINCSSFGMQKKELIEINYNTLKKETLILDIIYNPLETEFLKESRQYGFKTFNGIGMLIRQAAIAFNLWFDIDLSLEDITKARDILQEV